MNNYNKPRGYTHGKLWTPEEKEILRKHYITWNVTVKEISEMINRPQRNIYSMARRMGLKRPVVNMEEL